MPKHKFLLILTTLFTVFGLCVCAAAAQEINVDEMDNAQLLMLLQNIMQKLEQEDQTPEATAIPPLTDARTFQVYQNKKLIIESLPSYYFVNPTEVPEDPGKPGKPGNTPSCQDMCANACYGISYSCYYNCYIQCAGSPPPEPKG
jgi:hypothetical protein